MYQRIADDLLEKIQNGTYKPNDIIPSEIELAEEYDVSRPTVRQAIQKLSDAGFVEKRRKRGTCVCNRKFEQHFFDRLMSYQDDEAFCGVVAETKVLTLRVEHASSKVAGKLEVEEGDEVYQLLRLRYLGSDPAVLARTYIPAALYPNLLDYDFTHERLYDAYAKEGLPIDSVHRVLNTTLPDDISASLLDIDPTEPCFLTDSVGRAKTGEPIEYSVAVYRGDINSFTIDLSVSTE
jgi:GntR family transcriptional regulator